MGRDAGIGDEEADQSNEDAAGGAPAAMEGNQVAMDQWPDNTNSTAQRAKTRNQRGRVPSVLGTASGGASGRGEASPNYYPAGLHGVVREEKGEKMERKRRGGGERRI